MSTAPVQSSAASTGSLVPCDTGSAASPVDPEALHEAQNKFNRWRLIRTIWICVHYMFGLLSIGLSAAIAAKLIREPNLGWASALAAISAGVLTFLKSDAKATAYVRAVRPLEQALFDYKTDRKTPKDALNKAVHEGLEILNQQPGI